MAPNTSAWPAPMMAARRVKAERSFAARLARLMPAPSCELHGGGAAMGAHQQGGQSRIDGGGDEDFQPRRPERQEPQRQPRLQQPGEQRGQGGKAAKGCPGEQEAP